MRDWMLKVGDHLGGSAREIKLIDIAQVLLRNEKDGLKIDPTRIIRGLNLAITLTENHLWRSDRFEARARPVATRGLP